MQHPADGLFVKSITFLNMYGREEVLAEGGAYVSGMPNNNGEISYIRYYADGYYVIGKVGTGNQYRTVPATLVTAWEPLFAPMVEDSSDGVMQ